MKFIRRKSDVERYNRALSIKDSITFPTIKAKVDKAIKEYEINSKIIEYFANHPDLEEVKDDNSKDKKSYHLYVWLIGQSSAGVYIYHGALRCSLVGENYVDERLNVGADYHSLRVCAASGYIEYWDSKNKEFLLEQLLNQDKIEQMRDQYEIATQNYF